MPTIGKATRVELGLFATVVLIATSGGIAWSGASRDLRELQSDVRTLREARTAADLAELRRAVDLSWTIEDQRQYLHLARRVPLLGSLPTVEDLRFRQLAPWAQPSPPGDLPAQPPVQR